MLLQLAILVGVYYDELDNRLWLMLLSWKCAGKHFISQFHYTMTLIKMLMLLFSSFQTDCN